MTKSIRSMILERDQMYAEYVREISHHIGGKLSKSIGNVIFEGRDVNVVLEDINIILQNINYVSMVLLVTREADNSDDAQVIPSSTISFAIPIDILEKGNKDDITEYLFALKNDQEARGQPVPVDDANIDYVQKILERVKRNEKEDAMRVESMDELELDEIQKALSKFTEVKATKH